jgi:hypothetical protein
MMMSPEEIQHLDATAAKVRIEARRVELTALIERLRDHIQRVGPSPGIVGACDKACAELAALEQKVTSK